MSKKTSHILDRVLRWVVFGALFALAPVFYGWWQGDAELDAVISRGEVFVVTAALAAAALGEMLGPDAPKGYARTILFSACAAILVISTLAFANAAGLEKNPPTFKTQRDVDQFISKQTSRSIIVLAAMLVTGAAVMAVTAGPVRKTS